MKILQVIDSGGYYGAERVLIALMEALRDQSVDSALASIGEPGQPKKALETEASRRGLDVRRETLSAGPDRAGTRRLLSGAAREGFDLVHTHGYKANTLIAGMARKKRGLPAVATLHGWTATSRWSRVGIYETVERMALRRADAIVAVSQAMVRNWKLRSRYGDRLKVIHNGIPTPSPSGQSFRVNKELGAFVGDRQSVFAAGRLSYEKGFDVLLEAVAALRTMGLDICLVLVGEGRERHNLESRARTLGIEDAISMPGYIENAGGLMGNFDVVAIPSRTEGLPVVLLEALMVGIPVAATAVGEMPEVMQFCDVGGCAEPGEADSLAGILQARLTGPTARAKRLAVSEKAINRYSASAMSTAYLNLYKTQVTPA